MDMTLRQRFLSLILSKRLSLIFLLLVPMMAGAVDRQREVESTRGLKFYIEDQQGEQVILYEESHALVIGVSNYTEGWPKPVRTTSQARFRNRSGFFLLI